MIILFYRTNDENEFSPSRTAVQGKLKSPSPWPSPTYGRGDSQMHSVGYSKPEQRKLLFY